MKAWRNCYRLRDVFARGRAWGALAVAVVGGFGLARVAIAAQEPGAHAKVEVIADRPAGSSHMIWAGVLFHLDPGWHVYWENAGDSGTPPRIEWDVPSGYKAGTILWPVPVRLGHGSVVDYGYEGEVLLMAPIERNASAKPQTRIPISATVRYVVCSDICIPGKAHPRAFFSLGRTGDDPTLARWHAAFERTRAQLPKAAPAAWKVATISEKDDFVLSVRGGTAVKSAEFFPLDPDVIENSAPQEFAARQDGFQLTLKKSEQLSNPVATLRGLVVLDRGRAFEVTARVEAR